jgi:SNF family Na+-dependent transporter
MYLQALNSFITPSRIGILFLLLLLYVALFAVIRYLYSLFIMYCVIYTVTDYYKKRKKYLWIVRIVIYNIHSVLVILIGQDVIDNVCRMFHLSAKTEKRNNKKKI